MPREMVIKLLKKIVTQKLNKNKKNNIKLND